MMARRRLDAVVTLLGSFVAVMNVACRCIGDAMEVHFNILLSF